VSWCFYASTHPVDGPEAEALCFRVGHVQGWEEASLTGLLSTSSLFVSATHITWLVLAEALSSEHELAVGKLQLSKCDIYKVLANGATLFGSQGAEYDIHDVDGIESMKQFITGYL